MFVEHVVTMGVIKQLYYIDSCISCHNLSFHMYVCIYVCVYKIYIYMCVCVCVCVSWCEEYYRETRQVSGVLVGPLYEQ